VQQLFHDVALLVHLDGIDGNIVTLVVVLGNGSAEGLVNFTQAMPQDVAKTEQDRQLDTTGLQLVH
jgi:hypothetical protein